ncbi:MAG TPA: DUF3592 domain-containing protein [Terriglobales bacterium]|nr:DUF3592 domain-containing protein [Terriglobales bacterium]
MNSPAQPGEPLTASSGQPRRPGQTLKFLAVAIFVAFPLPLAFLSGLLAWHQYRILTTWPAVDAVVTKVDRTSVTTRTSRQPVTSYGARFSFRYSAAGRLYDSSADLGYTSSLRSDVEQWMAQMPVGSHQRIRYDPGNPMNISLAADYTPRSFAAPYRLAEWAGLIAVVCVVLFWLGWRAGRQESVVRSR